MMKTIFALNTGSTCEEESKIILQGLGLWPKPMQGCYKGEEEYSYLIEIAKQSDINKVLEFAKGFGQESILVIDGKGNAKLFFTNGAIQGIGVWKEVAKGVAVDKDAYTHDIETGKYFICE